MSYINDALRKAQQDKRSPYAAYEPIISAGGDQKTRSRKWFPVAGVLILLVCAAGIIFLFSISEEKKHPAKTPLRIAEAPVIVSPVAPVAEQITVENEAEPVLKTVRKTEEKTKVKTETADSKTLYAQAPQKQQKGKLKETKAPVIVSPVAPVAKQITVENKDEPVLKTARKTEEKTKVKTETADSKTLYAQALQKQQEGNLEEAGDLYKKVIEIDPRNVEALNNLGVVYMKKKNYKWAIIQLNEALKIKHDYSDAHYNLACIYAQNNDLSRSISYLKNAVGFNPQVTQWAQNDKDLSVLADLPEFKKFLETK